MKSIRIIGSRCPAFKAETLSVINFTQKRCFKAKWVAPTLKELKVRKDVEDDRNGGPKIFHRSTFLEW